MSNKRPRRCSITKDPAINILSCPRKRASSLSAFSLVELLLALIIFSVIALSLFSMLTNGLRLEDSSRYIRATSHQARMAFELLTKELENVRPYDFSKSYEGKFAFNGQAHELSFLVSSPEGIKAVRYYLETPKRGKVSTTIVGGHSASIKDLVADSKEESAPLYVLMRQEMSLPKMLNDQAKDEARDAEVVAGNIKEGGFKCLFAQKPSLEDLQSPTAPAVQGLTWVEQWQKDGLPAAVKITLVTVDPRGKRPDAEFTREIGLQLGENPQWGLGSKAILV